MLIRVVVRFSHNAFDEIECNESPFVIVDAKMEISEEYVQLISRCLSTHQQVAFARTRALQCGPGAASSCCTCYNADILDFAAGQQQGLAVPMTEILSDAFDGWRLAVSRHYKIRCVPTTCTSTSAVDEEKKSDDDEALLGQEQSSTKQGLDAHLSGCKETNVLRQILSLHAQICRLDSTLAEELGREGQHIVLSKLARFDLESEIVKANGLLDYTINISEEDTDTVMELQDLACEIGSLCAGFPLKFAPFTIDELRHRLPLSFEVSSVGIDSNSKSDNTSQNILIHQVTSRQGAQEDVGFVMWPSAVALSAWIMSNQEQIVGKRVLEIGAGCGLTGLAAASIASTAAKDDTSGKVNSDSSQVILTDFNETVLQNLDRNICLNALERIASCAKLDFYLQKGDNEKGGWVDGTGTIRKPVDIILAADVICKPDDAVAAANTIYDVLVPGGRAFIISADARHRFGVERFEDECDRVGLDVISVSNVADLYDGALLSKGIEQTSGFVEGMTLTMFTIRKRPNNT